MTDDLMAMGQRRRIIWLSSVFVAMGVFLMLRLAWWQLVPRAEAADWFDEEDQPTVTSGTRGTISDSTGHYLAASTVTYKVAVSPSLLSNDQKEKLIPELASILGSTREEMAKLLHETDYAILGAELSDSVGRQIEALGTDAFNIEVNLRRVYPDGSLAAHVLGFVDYKGTGQYGVEQYYNRELRGVDGQWYGVSDPWGKQILVSLKGYTPAEDGADLVVTLDRNVQQMAEKILREGVEQNKATCGNMIVLDPRTGAVLALSNYPAYRPGAYWDVDTLDRYINTSMSAIHEPGSVFKPLTLAAALAERVIRPTDTYDDRGEIIVGQQRIWNSDRKAHGRTTMTELLGYSRNVGAAHVATILGSTRFYEMIRRFGFGETTGVDLAFEEEGIMRVPGDTDWHMSDLATNSFGQGISVTPLQVAAAYAAIANDGVLMRPYVVSEIRGDDTTEVKEPFRVRRVIPSDTAQEITRLMADAVELGMKEAVLTGYRLAGKSGTAGIPDQEGYQSRHIIASFVGFGPVPDPRFVILVKLDRPREGYWGVEVAAPEFRRMAKFLVDYYGIPPTHQ